MILANKKTLHEVLNCEKSECRVYFNRTNSEIEICDDFFSLRNYVLDSDIVFFPTDEKLYPYCEAMGDFLDEHEIEVPRGEKAESCLRKNGLIYDFYAFREEEIKSRLLDWLNENDIQLEII